MQNSVLVKLTKIKVSAARLALESQKHLSLMDVNEERDSMCVMWPLKCIRIPDAGSSASNSDTAAVEPPEPASRDTSIVQNDGMPETEGLAPASPGNMPASPAKCSQPGSVSSELSQDMSPPRVGDEAAIDDEAVVDNQDISPEQSKVPIATSADETPARLTNTTPAALPISVDTDEDSVQMDDDWNEVSQVEIELLGAEETLLRSLVDAPLDPAADIYADADAEKERRDRWLSVKIKLDVIHAMMRVADTIKKGHGARRVRPGILDPLYSLASNATFSDSRVIMLLLLDIYSSFPRCCHCYRLSWPGSEMHF